MAPKPDDLPAGFTITSIDGRRCTKVPRSLTTIAGETTFATTTTTKDKKTTSTQDPPPPGSTTSTTQDSASSSVAQQPAASSSAAAVAAPSAAPEITTASTSASASTSTAAAIPVAVSTSAALVDPEPAAAAPSSISVSAVPASKGTTPTISSSTLLPLPQSELSATPTPTAANADGLRPVTVSRTPTSISATASAGPEVSSATAASSATSSTTKQTVAPIMGGVVGGIALVGIVSLILWCFRRRRRRNSLLTPLSSSKRSQFYEIDRGSVGPTKRTVIWRANIGSQTDRIRDAATDLKSRLVEVGASLKSKVVERSNSTRSVNLNRGNSQFLDGPIPQHSRNNSSVLSGQTGELTTKDRFADWWERFTENVMFNWRLRSKERDPIDPFAAARGMTEKQANGAAPDFSQLLGADERGLQLQADRRRASLRNSFSGLGGLGLDFESLDPFADPLSRANYQTDGTKTNPFADPITHPETTVHKQPAYITDIRRSRGVSVDNTYPNNNTISAYRPPSISGPTSHYPSSIAPSRDSYRDTVFSTFSLNVRKGKGRSDPFDLERPELLRTKDPPLPTMSTKAYPDPLRMSSARDGTQPQPRMAPTQMKRVESTAHSYTSKYSSGVSSLGDWGDPGPDLGPGSSNGSLHRHNGGGGSMGSLEEIERGWDKRRGADNVSPISMQSKVSSQGGVGKAM